MRYDSGQFGSFDGLDNRKLLMDLFRRMGHGLPDDLARSRRGGFIQALLDMAQGSFKGSRIRVTGCSAAEAYTLFVHVTGVLGVPIEEATKKLELVVRQLVP